MESVKSRRSIRWTWLEKYSLELLCSGSTSLGLLLLGTAAVAGGVAAESGRRIFSIAAAHHCVTLELQSRGVNIFKRVDPRK